MEYSINEIPGRVRRRLKKIMQKSKDIRHARRTNAILLLHRGLTVSEVSRQLSAARSAIRGWRSQFEQFCEAGLAPETPGRKPTTVTEGLGAHLLKLIDKEPKEYAYLHSRWTSEMLVDEVDIDFNPRIGNSGMKKGHQSTIPTPGKNQKRYLAGALNTVTDKIVWVEWEKKNSEIFILLLAELKKRYRKAKKITLIADNYIIHKSAMTKCFLEHNDKFKILFQPAYHPWVNKIELVWKQLHDAITRNHKFSTMNKLMAAVHQFMSAVSPFPGAKTCLVKL